MNVRPSILCPVDFSPASAGALRYAAAIAEHFVTRLIVLAVEDPVLTETPDRRSGTQRSHDASQRELAAFVKRTFAADEIVIDMCEYDVTVGKPARQILRIARERCCDLIVMSSHGTTGAHLLSLGSTTEHVLRETNVPVLVTPPLDSGPVHVEDARRLIERVVAPVDLSSSTDHQVRVARGLADALDLPLLLVHVIEPVKTARATRPDANGAAGDREAFARDRLHGLVAVSTIRERPETIVVHGDPAEEVAKVVRDRGAGIVVMGLHGSPSAGPRMGSVTYRMICLTPTLVLALPPKHALVLPCEPPVSAVAS
jgi:nucleotide-binding universal stress UspA family protein